MTAKKQPKAKTETEREKRVAEALRENLRKRKIQQQTRADDSSADHNKG